MQRKGLGFRGVGFQGLGLVDFGPCSYHMHMMADGFGRLGLPP